MTKQSSGRARSGGGPTMNKVRQVGVKAGSPNTLKVSVDAASSIGRSVGNHVSDGSGSRNVQRPNTPLYAEVKAPVRYGNDLARNVGRGGPGAGRVVMPCGSQGTHGPVNPGGPPIAPTPGGGPGGFGFGKGR
jgi:hypothetical protein